MLRLVAALLVGLTPVVGQDPPSPRQVPDSMAEILARSRGETAEVRALVAGRDPNARDSHMNRPALQWSIVLNDARAFRRLLDSKPDLAATDKEGRTALHAAAAFAGQFDTRPYAEALLARGANANAKAPGGLTALMMAANGKSPAVVELIVARVDRETLNARDQFGRTALASAAFLGEYETVHILLENGADVDAADKEGKTPLMLAAGASHGSEPTVQRLLLAKADPNARDKAGRTALDEAKQNGTPGPVDLLRKAGAK